MGLFSAHTSVKARVEDCRTRGVLEEVADQPSDRTRMDQNLEDESFWLAPIEERRERGGERAGITSQVTLASYLRLLDWSARLLRPGKSRMPFEVAGILERLGAAVMCGVTDWNVYGVATVCTGWCSRPTAPRSTVSPRPEE